MINKLIVLWCALLFSACAVLDKKNVNDHKISQILVGNWKYVTGPANCKNYTDIGFRQNGKYTRTSESCDFVDDGFGIYSYGWYIANGYICFVSSSEHLKHAKTFGYAKEHCYWEVKSFNSSEITIHEHDWFSEGNEPEALHLKKQ